MTLSNRLIYEDRLRCGNEEVANRVLVLIRRFGQTVLNLGITYTGDDGGCWFERLADER
jgi:DNA replication ATP-dependent helicase Dna2